MDTGFCWYTAGMLCRFDEEQQEIQRIRKELGTRFCRQCQYCMPCAQDVNIWMMMIVTGMHKLWPLKDFIRIMEPFVESGRECIQCGECEPKCPYNLPIRDMIQEHIDFFDTVTKDA